MAKKICWLKASYLAGAIADGILVILFLIPSRMGVPGYRYPMGLAASLMSGWTLLLIWGYQDPVERKGLLLITIFPVITGLLASGFHMLATGAFSLAKVFPSTSVGIILIALMGFSYFNAREINSD